MRTFDTGATRDTDHDKYDYEGFLSPLALERFAAYMHQHRIQADGSVRASDNWQKGMPLDAYMKSGYRHFMDWWKEHRGLKSQDGLEDALCAILFNVQGYLHETLLAQGQPCYKPHETVKARMAKEGGTGVKQDVTVALDANDFYPTTVTFTSAERMREALSSVVPDGALVPHVRHADGSCQVSSEDIKRASELAYVADHEYAGPK